MFFDFAQGRFHSTSPGDFGSTYTEAGDSETNEGLRVENATRGSLGRALLWLPRNECYRKEASQGGAAASSERQRKRGPWIQGQGGSSGWAAAACSSSGCKFCGDPWSLGGSEKFMLEKGHGCALE